MAFRQLGFEASVTLEISWKYLGTSWICIEFGFLSWIGQWTQFGAQGRPENQDQDSQVQGLALQSGVTAVRSQHCCILQGRVGLNIKLVDLKLFFLFFSVVFDQRGHRNWPPIGFFHEPV